MNRLVELDFGANTRLNVRYSLNRKVLVGEDYILGFF